MMPAEDVAAHSMKRPLLALLLLYALCGQGISLSPVHPHGQSSGHCCALCHVSPLPFLQPASSMALIPELPLAWVIRCAQPDEAHEVLFANNSTRAPPA
jgi:hypothetical protein